MKYYEGWLIFTFLLSQLWLIGSLLTDNPSKSISMMLMSFIFFIFYIYIFMMGLKTMKLENMVKKAKRDYEHFKYKAIFMLLEKIVKSLKKGKKKKGGRT